jgi:hypothetical protein
MWNSSTLWLQEKLMYRRRTVLSAFASGGSLAGLGTTATQERRDEVATTAEEPRPFAGGLSGRENDSEPFPDEYGVFTEDDSSTGTLFVLEPPAGGRAEFVVREMVPRNTTVTEGDAFDLSATVENVGATTGTHFVEMEASLASDARAVEIAPGESTTVTFPEIDTGGFPTGEHLLAIFTPHDGLTGTLTIEPAGAGSGDDAAGSCSDGAD